MDYTYFIIILIAIILFFLDKYHKIPNITEKFNDLFSAFPPKKLGVDFNAPSPDQFGALGMTNIKIPGVPRWKSTMSPTTFGAIPYQPRCNVTVIGENCSNFPQPDGSTNNLQPICQQSYNTYPQYSFYPNGNYDFKAPIYVMGRSLSRVRQCRDIYNPKN